MAKTTPKAPTVSDAEATVAKLQEQREQIVAARQQAEIGRAHV